MTRTLPQSDKTIRRSILILGTRGIPAAHGGFETFAEHLALFLVGRGWHVIVYCQNETSVLEERLTVDMWRGVERRHVSVCSTGPRATLEFDWHCVRDAARHEGICLVLGYNSGVFIPYLRLRGRRIMTNMDGIEWRRPKWGVATKCWFWINEWIAAWASHRLIADHPVIADHIATRRSRTAITMIPYGGREVLSASETAITALGLQAGGYLVSIARVEPDNNIKEMVEAFSRRRRHAKLVVLGTLDRRLPYHRAVLAAASDEVIFPGAIYDAESVAALRFYARAYLHGHTVGGTNPSLVEALWAGNAVIAHDNAYNRWTAGDAGLFFRDIDECEHLMESVLAEDAMVERARRAARSQAATHFNWADILSSYENEALYLLEGERSHPAIVDIPVEQRQ